MFSRITEAVLLNNCLKLLTGRSATFSFQIPRDRLTRLVYSSRAVDVKRGSPASSRSSCMELQGVVAELHKMYPPCLAEDWDNVGLLVEPSSDPQQQFVNHVFLTNDLTEQVMEEIDKAVPKVGLVIAYHPPIFKPLKTLTRNTAKERIIVKAVEARLAIYSPHTAADSVCGGVNDWLAEGLGGGETKPLRPVAPRYDVMACQLTGQQCEIVKNEMKHCSVKWQEKLRCVCVCAYVHVHMCMYVYLCMHMCSLCTCKLMFIQCIQYQCLMLWSIMIPSRDDSYFDITVQCKLDILPQVYTLVSGQPTPHNLPVCVVPCKVSW